MQSFPHQISDIQRLLDALRVIADLIRSNDDVGNDETLGVALARAQVYTFRGGFNLEEALRRERAKKKSNRGTEAAARDLRRLFLLMRLVDLDTNTGRYLMTESGRRLLETDDTSIRRELLRSAMRAICLESEGQAIFHPYNAMLRLIERAPGIEKRKLLLAFEVRDDSALEIDRVVELAGLDFDDILARLGVTRSSANNSVKILPSIAQQIDDIRVNQGRCFATSAVILMATEDGVPMEARREHGNRVGAIEVLPEVIAREPEFAQIEQVTIDLSAAIAERNRRTAEHNRAVRLLAGLLHRAGFRLYEYPYDCLAVDDAHRALLVEVKTLDGSRADERRQAERALGQVKGYLFFVVCDTHREHEIVELVAFTLRPADATVGFLRSLGVRTIWLENEEWMTLNEQGRSVAFEPMALF